MKPIVIQLQKYALLFSFLGVCLILVGISAGVVSATWGVIPLSLMGIGLLGFLLGLILQFSTQGFWGQRSTQISTNALVSTLSVLAILALINFLAVRYAIQTDLTETRLYTLAPESQQVVRNLKQPVKVWVFVNPADPAATNLRSALDLYRRQNQQKFSFELVDPNAQPNLSRKFGVKEFGEAYLEAGDRRQLLQTVNRGTNLSESKLTNALALLSSDRQTRVYFLQGHGELPLEPTPNGLSQALTLLSEKNFVTTPLSLVEQAKVPSDAAVVIIAGPKQPLLATETRALVTYLQQGGSVLLLIDPTNDSKLDDLLNDWGVKLENDFVINASEQRVSQDDISTAVVTNYGNHPITREFGNRFSVYPLARTIQTVTVKGVQATPLLLTSSGTWAEKDLVNTNLQLNPDKGDRPGPLTLGVALSRSITSAPPSPPLSPSATVPSPPAEARLVVIGNSTFAANTLFKQQFVNGDLFINTINWLSKEGDRVLSIRPKETANRQLTLTPTQANLVGLLALLILPLIGFGTAGAAWWLRR